MKHMHWCCGAALLFLACGAWAQTIEVPLQYERYPDHEEERQFRPSNGTCIMIETAPPEGEWIFPERVSARPLYGWLELGEAKRLLVLDQSSKDAPFYDRIYIDANANHDLTDDPVLDAYQSDLDDSFFLSLFPGMDIQIKVDGESLPYCFTTQVSYSKRESTSWGDWMKGMFTKKTGPKEPIDPRFLSLCFISHCMYSADLEIAGVKYRVMLGDSNVNGRFDDRAEIRTEQPGQAETRTRGDEFFMIPVDVKASYYDGQELGKYLCHKDKVYALDVSITQNRLSLTPLTENVGALDLAMPTQNFSMIGEAGCVMAVLPEKTILAPAGDYRLLKYVMLHDEAEGARWHLVASGGSDAPKIISLAADTVSTFSFGPPFRPTVSVPDWSLSNFQSGEDVYLQLSVIGAAQERVVELACISDSDKSKVTFSKRDKRRPKEATYKVLKGDGEVVIQGTFEYG